MAAMLESITPSRAAEAGLRSILCGLLRALGIKTRSARLAQGLQGVALQSHLAATRRLTDDVQMGTLFKALVLYPADAPQPPGFA